MGSSVGEKFYEIEKFVELEDEKEPSQGKLIKQSLELERMEKSFNKNKLGLIGEDDEDSDDSETMYTSQNVDRITRSTG